MEWLVHYNPAREAYEVRLVDRDRRLAFLPDGTSTGRYVALNEGDEIPVAFDLTRSLIRCWPELERLLAGKSRDGDDETLRTANQVQRALTAISASVGAEAFSDASVA